MTELSNGVYGFYVPIQQKINYHNEVKADKKMMGPPPLYIGIDAMDDKNFRKKLKDLFMQSLDQMSRAFPEQNMFTKMITNIGTLLQINNPQTPVDDYKIRPTYHVTSLFMGGKEENSPIYKNFEEGKRVNIPIKALLFVPGRIMTGICFPDAEISNKMPHMTLLLGKWPAKNSNMALECSCSNKSQPFYDIYHRALSEGSGGPDHCIFAPSVKFDKETLPAYFLILETPIVFEGVNKCFSA